MDGKEEQGRSNDRRQETGCKKIRRERVGQVPHRGPKHHADVEVPSGSRLRAAVQLSLFPLPEARGADMLTIMWILISVVTALLIGSLFGIATHGKSDDDAQLEYLSRWSDMKRLRK